MVYLHNFDICHRDIKPENFLLKYRNDIKSIKLIDFGVSRQTKSDQWLQGIQGTPFYTAPEVLKGKYDKKCDLWSLGVTIYILLSGKPPFNGDSN